jgi:hypothetical protein
VGTQKIFEKFSFKNFSDFGFSKVEFQMNQDFSSPGPNLSPGKFWELLRVTSKRSGYSRWPLGGWRSSTKNQPEIFPTNSTGFGEAKVEVWMNKDFSRSGPNLSPGKFGELL